MSQFNVSQSVVSEHQPYLGLARSTGLQAYLRMTKTGTPGMGPAICFNKPTSDSDACQGLRTTELVSSLAFGMKSLSQGLLYQLE